MIDSLELLDKIVVRKRRRLLNALIGAESVRPSSAFLRALFAELGDEPQEPVFFGTDVELDAIYAAFSASAAYTAAAVSKVSGNLELRPFDDSRGLIELDGLRIDAVLLFQGSAEDQPDPPPLNLVLIFAKVDGKWSGRRFRRVVGRLRRCFGEDGASLPLITPRFIALGPERLGPTVTAAWPAWMKRQDGSTHWLPFTREEDELSIVRCNRRGRPQRAGNYWKLVQALSSTLTK